jgi:hypothetical protein
MTAAQVRALPDDAPCSMFAPCPVTPWQAAHEDYAEHVYYNRYSAGTAEWRQYEDGWQDAKQEGSHGYYH